MRNFGIRSLLFGGLLLTGVAGARPVPNKVLFVLLGGYNSCNKTSRHDLPPAGIKMQPFFQKFLKKIAAAYPKTQMLTLAGCLDTSAPPLGEGMYIDSENPTSLKNADSYGVKDRVEELLKKNPGMPLFLIGHSYGGWMSMFLAEELSGPPNLRGLFTIDPIGPECDALGVVLGDSACHEAPTDRNNKTIQKRAEVWANFYQDTDSWISSSAIKEAKNTHYEAEWGPHSDIAERGDLWSSLEHSVNASLAK